MSQCDIDDEVRRKNINRSIDIGQRITNVITYLALKPIENSKQIQHLLEQQNELKTMIDQLDLNNTREEFEKLLFKIVQEQLIPIEEEIETGIQGKTIPTLTTTTRPETPTTFATTLNPNDFDPKLLEQIKTILKPCELEINGEIHSQINCNLHVNNLSAKTLKDKFSTLSKILRDDQKHFKMFIMDIGNDRFDFIENQFVEIKFQKLNINQFNGTMDKNAFNGTNTFIKEVSFSANYNNYNEVSKAINTFENLEFLELTKFNNYNLNKRTFDKLRNLQYLRFDEGNINNFTANVFKYLGEIEDIYFYFDNSPRFPDFAFEFEQESNVILAIYFNDKFNSSLLSDKTLLQIRRPTFLNFVKLPEVPENKFRQFLDENSNNMIHAYSIDCNNCNNYWLFRNYLSSVNGRCSNGIEFNDEQNFRNS